MSYRHLFRAITPSFALIVSASACVLIALSLSAVAVAQDRDESPQDDRRDVPAALFDQEALPTREDWKAQRRLIDEKALVPDGRPPATPGQDVILRAKPQTLLEEEYQELLRRFHDLRQVHQVQRKVFEQKLRMLQADVEAARKVQAQLEAYKKKAHVTPLPEDAEIKVFALRNLPAENAVETVESLLGAQAFRVAIDDRTNSLIVAGKAAQIQLVEALLTRLDAQDRPPSNSGKETTAATPSAAPRSLLLRVFWLADGLPEGEGQDPTQFLPQSVLAALEKLGLSDARLVTQTVNSLAVGTEEAVEFSTHVPSFLFKQPAGFSSRGRVRLVPADRAVLDISIQVVGPSTNELSGSLATPLGHYMVLGTANSVIGDAALRGGMERYGEMGLRGRGEMARGGGVGRRGGFPGEGGYGAFGGEMGGMMAADEPAAEPKFSTSRFAFVVQVIEGESFPVE